MRQLERRTISLFASYSFTFDVGDGIWQLDIGAALPSAVGLCRGIFVGLQEPFWAGRSTSVATSSSVFVTVPLLPARIGRSAPVSKLPRSTFVRSRSLSSQC